MTTETKPSEGTAQFYRGIAILMLRALPDAVLDVDRVTLLASSLAAAFERGHALGAASRASPEAACAGCGGCGDGRSWADVERVLNDLNVSQDPAVRGVVQMIRARLPRPGCPDGHRSDCATHNEPAFPNGPCDCGRASPEEGRAPIRWDPRAFGFHDLDELNRRYGAGRFVAVGGPDTLYDRGPDRTGRKVVPVGWWICDGPDGVAVIARERPSLPAALRSPPAPSEDTRRCADCGIEAAIHEQHRPGHPFRAPPPEDSGARALPCGCVVCVCEDAERCHGCGAEECPACRAKRLFVRAFRDEPCDCGGTPPCSHSCGAPASSKEGGRHE